MKLALSKYPGGKSMQLKYLYNVFDWAECNTLIDVCAGMGSVALNAIGRFDKVIVNDKDSYINNVWTHFIDESLFLQLKTLILNTNYDMDTYWKARNIYCKGYKSFSNLDIAWATIVSHRMSRNAMPCNMFQQAGRLRGGQNECINAWESYQKSLDAIHDATKKVELWKEDICDIVNVVNDKKTLLYCVHPNQKARTENERMIKISSLKVGDKLFGDREVLNISSKDYDGWMYKIWLTGQLDPILLTEDHYVLATDGNYNKRQDTRSFEKIFNSKKNKKVCNLKEKDYMFIPLGGKENRYSGILNNPDFYKILGYFTAEGHTVWQNPAKKKQKVAYSSVFSFNITETDTLAKDVYDCVKRVFGKKSVIAKHSPHKTVTSVRINSKKISQIIRKYIKGVSINKRLTSKIMIAPKYLQMELLKCWLKGDGGIFDYGRNRIRITGTSSSYKLIRQMMTISYRLGLKPNLKKRKSRSTFSKRNPNHTKEFTTYDLIFSLHDAKKLGYNVETKRKDVSYKKEFNGHIMTPIKKIKKYRYVGKVYDIKVSKDSLFACPYALVHNCDVPYMMETRVCKLYRTEMTDNKHKKFLKACRDSDAKIVISGRPTELYNYMLYDWQCDIRKINNNMSHRKGPARVKTPECVWTNFKWIP